MAEASTRGTSRKTPHYFTQILSVSLMLFVLGVLAAFLLQARKQMNKALENQVLQVELNREISTEEIAALQKSIQNLPSVRETKFISREEALNVLKEKTGDVKMELLDENPLYDAFEIKLKAEKVSPVQVMKLRDEIKSMNKVSEVHYRELDIKTIDSSIDRITWAILSITAVLFIISLFIINATIRLAMYSNRFLIRSMQLVGATRWFILKPFVNRSLLNGLISGLIATLAVGGIAFYLDSQFPGLALFKDPIPMIMVSAAIVVLGILFSFVSTWLATRRYLKMELDRLY